MIEPGAKIADRYVVLKLLGGGGMGVVHLARDERLGREVAIKVLRTESDAACRRLLREARATSVLEPSRVAQVFDVGEMEDGSPYVVMEYVRGKTVRALLVEGRVARDEALRIVREVATTLGLAHRAGLVHRDVKPDNVIVRDDDGRVVLLDFGIVKQITPSVDAGGASTKLTAAGTMIGTPAYLAPEQALGLEVVPGSDQFALGVMAFELLTGQLPWSATDMTGLIEQILRERPPAATTIDARLPRGMDAALWRAMSKTPSARFETIEAFSRALDEAERGDLAPAGGMMTVEDAAAIPRADAPRVKTASPSGARLGLHLTASPSGARLGLHLKRKRWLPVVLGVLALGAAAVGATCALRGRGSRAAAAVTASSGAVGPMTPPPFAVVLDRSKDPRVARAYAAAMQAARDASFDGLLTNLQTALKIEPSNAPAHLAMLMWGFSVGPGAQEHYQRAYAQRATLDERERTLLAALEPMERRPDPDSAETVRRLREALGRSPNDGDLRYQLARTQWFADDLRDAVDLLEGITQRDPTFALAWYDLASDREYLGDKEGAIRAYGSCLAAAASASECLMRLGDLQAREGMCAEAEATVRRAIAVSPDSASSYEQLAAVLDARDAGPAAVRATADEAIRWQSEPERAIARALWRTRIGGAHGDLDEVLRATKDWKAALSEEVNAEALFLPVEAEVEALVESGRRRDAQSSLRNVLKRMSAWPTASIAGIDIELTTFLYRAGGLSKNDFAARRDQWLVTSGAAAQLASWLQAAQRWWFAYAEPAVTPEDAREALIALPRFPPLLAAPARSPWYDASVGEVYRLAGRYREALPYYQRSAAACTGLSWPLAHMRSILGLGLTLEALQDRAGACSAYRRVLAAWDGARPRSVTAESARARTIALACP